MIDAIAPSFAAPLTFDAQRINAAAKEFEAVFIAQVLAPLFSSVKTPEIAGGGKSEEFFNSLLQESYAKAMAERGGFGLADHVKSSLIDLQGAHPTTPSRQE
ncbi:MAG: rod-binding protein [Pseudomonadota bacterium]